MATHRYEIIRHGVEYPDHFAGCGVAHTPFDGVVTGIGENAKEAYEDAVGQIYQALDTAQVEALRLPRHPRGVRVSDRVPASMGDAYYYLSIRYNA